MSSSMLKAVGLYVESDKQIPSSHLYGFEHILLFE